MILVKNKFKFVYFILLQVSPENRRKLEVVVMVLVNNLEDLILALFQLVFSNAHFQEILENDHKVLKSQRRWGREW